MNQPFKKRIYLWGTLFAACAIVLSGCDQQVTTDRSNQESTAEGNKPVVPKLQEISKTGYDTEIVASGLNVPWEIAFASGDRIYFTERPGKVRVIQGDKLQEKPLLTLEEPFVSSGEGGLLGLALDPAFDTNSYLYVYHTYTSGAETRNRVLRLVQEGDTARIDRTLIDGIPGAENHNGGRIKFGPDGMLYITAGDKYEPSLAQDQQSLGGKILRIRPDGTIPDDNPFPGSPVYSWGHRNAQGLAWEPGSGNLFSSEHGQSAHDELNVVIPGGNYGWPLIEGDETTAKDGVSSPALIPPLLHSGRDTWAPSGMTFVTQGPWKGRLVAAGLRGTRLLVFSLEAEKKSGPAAQGSPGDAGKPPVYRITAAELAYKDVFGRLRTVSEGKDGFLYLLTNNRDGRGKPAGDDDKIIRLKPSAP
ncbi:sorbosone dehydrogenase family protein [Paenibacillus sp. FJAT-26967]|uniref:PQQ-dependent sugar dehydrogenase n=1 Tax=Paenibacillus sp. FJAT-26967 TaxID=1729690 RepID=UPI000839607D|nr:PQQ-dependent sugar dehydrogenase [Paenibacillus sp. FJAT-26967]